MNIIIKSIFISLILFTANMVVFAQTEQKTHQVVIEEIYYFNELDFSFYQAYNEFLNGENAKSGARLKRAAYFVQLEADNAKAYNKKPILNQAKKLNSLADSIALGKIHMAFKLRRAFAETHNVLANDYKLRAAAFWVDKKTEETGQALVAGAGYIGHAAKWSGQKVEKAAVGVGQGAKKAGVQSVRGLRWLGGNMMEGVAFVPSKVGQGLSWLGNSIDKVGESVKSKNKK